MPPQAIKITGLTEFRRALRALDVSFPRELQRAHKQVAQLVARLTADSFAGRAGVAPKVAPSVRALAGQGYAAVKIGGDRYPFALGSEFGSVRYKQFPAWRGSGQGAGYSLYEVLRSEDEEIFRLYTSLVDGLVERAFRA